MLSDFVDVKMRDSEVRRLILELAKANEAIRELQSENVQLKDELTRVRNELMYVCQGGKSISQQNKIINNQAKNNTYYELDDIQDDGWLQKCIDFVIKPPTN